MTDAVKLIREVCRWAGLAGYLADIQAGLDDDDILRAIETHDTAEVFDWLMMVVSYQGISDTVAAGYLEAHGNVGWREIAASLDHADCPKLTGYWTFHDCGFRKSAAICREPRRYDTCPLPWFDLRNGRLNQTAYSLYLFIRDIADGDLIGWIDGRIEQAARDGGTPLDQGKAILEPLRNVHGVSDKVIAMALSVLLMGARPIRPTWFEVGIALIVVDTLVHQFLVRTGILTRLGASHSYGPACYRPGGCAEIIMTIARRIDARRFNPAFPKVFPRFVQFAIWRYCSQAGLDICNGNRIHAAVQLSPVREGHREGQGSRPASRR